MSDSKQYLFTANGSYFGRCLVALVFIVPVIYGIIDRGGVDLNPANVLMLPLCVALLLSFAAMTEACMMIKVNKYLFAYNAAHARMQVLEAIDKYRQSTLLTRQSINVIINHLNSGEDTKCWDSLDVRTDIYYYEFVFRCLRNERHDF